MGANGYVSGACEVLASGTFGPGQEAHIAACIKGEHSSVGKEDTERLVSSVPEPMRRDVRDALADDDVKPDESGLLGLIREAEEWERVKAGKGGDNGTSGAPIHRRVADWLIHDRGARFVCGVPVVRDGICYSAGPFNMERCISLSYPNLKRSQRAEAMATVTLEAPRDDGTAQQYVGFKNGILDVRTGRFYQEGVPDAVVTNQIPHDWNPDAACHAVDSFLDSVSCNDAATRANLEELAGHCLYRGREFHLCWVLTGGGGNGKSTFLQMLSYALGEENYSAMQPDDLSKRFQGVNLAGKLAVLADDASSQTIGEDLSAAIKRISAGNLIHSDIKNHDGIDFRPYSTLVLCYNRFPSIKSNDEGFMRRFTPVHFGRHFSPHDQDYDAFLGAKLCTEEAAERFLVLAVGGLKRLLERGIPTENAASEEMRREVRIDNDSVLAWIDDALLTQQDVLHKPVGDVYKGYSEWCEGCGIKPKVPNQFSKTIKRQLGVQTKQTRVFDQETGRKVVLRHYVETGA